MLARNHSDGYEKTTRKNTVRLAFWTIPWLATMALATFGPEYLWVSNPASWAAILANLIAGVGLILAYRRYIQGLDELQRRIMLEAMAITLGVGIVGGLAYTNMDAADLIASDAEIGFLVLLMGFVYILATFVGVKRYK